MTRPTRAVPVQDVQAYLEALRLFMAAARDHLDDPTYELALPLLEQLRHIPEPRDPGDPAMPDLLDPDQPDKPPRDLFAPDPSGRCLGCRAGSHNACRGPRTCRCTHHTHADRGDQQ